MASQTNYALTTTSSGNRQVIKQSLSAICTTNGFDYIKQSSLEMLSDLMISYITSISQEAKLVCEVAGRSSVNPTDVWLALINNGHNVMELPSFLQQICATGSVFIGAPKHSASTSQTTPLRVGRCRPHPPHVNEYLPKFPDPHTYIKTEISGDPESSYEKVREVAATRKRNTEQSLIDYMLRVHPKTYLFRQFEKRVREEARQAMRDRERQKDALERARRQAKADQNMRMALVDNDIPDQLMEDDEDEQPDKDPGANDHDEQVEQFELEDTENSLVLRRIPTYCAILDPSLESRPYLSALVPSEEATDDESNEVTALPNPQHNQQNNTDEQTYDNPYLRAPRMPQKNDAMEF